MIEGSITGRWYFKGPEHIARVYGSSESLREFRSRKRVLFHVGNYDPDFAQLEARTLAYYSDCDPRNHYGKFANRRAK